MQLQLPYTGILYHVINFLGGLKKTRKLGLKNVVLVLNFQYQLVARLRDHDNPQSN